MDGEGAAGLDLIEVFCDATDIARKYQQGETEVTIPLNTYIASGQRYITATRTAVGSVAQMR